MPSGRNLGRRLSDEHSRTFLQRLFPCCTGKTGNRDSYDLRHMRETMGEEENKGCWHRFLSFLASHFAVYQHNADDIWNRDTSYGLNERTPFKDTNRSALGNAVNRVQFNRAVPFTKHSVRYVGLHEQRVFYDEGKVQVGSVVWTGYRTEQRECFDNNLLIVLRVDNAYESATNGTFEGQELVKRRNDDDWFIMLAYMNTSKVPVFENGDYCIVLEEEWAERDRFHGGFITEHIDDSYKFTELNTNFRDKADQKYSNIYAAYRLRKAPIPECDIVSDHTAPISEQLLNTFIGRNKGIQGWHNSCYLDTLLFSFFAFSNQFDDIFIKAENMDHDYLLVLNLLRYNIVYPLRACHFVSSHHISELRHLMASRIDEKFEVDSRDIPETMDALFCKLLRVGPFLSIGQSTKDQCFFDDSYTAECIGMNNEKFPTSELLLENAAVQMDFSFEKMPNCFILQLPRESERDGCVLPSYTLDLKNLLYRSVKMCQKCRCNATFQFPYLIVRSRNLDGTFYCEACAKNSNLDFARSKQLPEPNISSLADEETVVEMHALICIEKSHYNCYVRCGERWIFFDSMSDQETLENPATHEQETFNIPLVKEMPHFGRWIKDAHRSVRNTNSLNTFFSTLGQLDQVEYERAQRIFRFPYCIIYRKSEL